MSIPWTAAAIVDPQRVEMLPMPVRGTRVDQCPLRPIILIGTLGGQAVIDAHREWAPPVGDPARLTGVYGSPWMLMRAAARVFTSSMAMVIGPTPPGTGVIASAFSDTGPKSTSPTRR